jgi:class 3 adenylate cyclase/pimeloyl-ACP methyl ester carboxylesterase
MEPRIQYAKTIDGVSIAFAALGSGPPVVFSSVLWGDIALYRVGGARRFGPASADNLVEAGRCVTLYDGRGSGLSDREPAEFTVEARVEDLEAVIDTLGGGAVDLVGRLQGSPTAVAYAAKHPARVRRLVLWNPFASGAEYYAATPYTRSLRAFASAAIEDWDFLTLTVATWVMGFSDHEAARNLAMALRGSLTKESYLKGIEDLLEVDVSELLSHISMPTLVIQDTSAEFLATPQLVKPLASRIPGAQFVAVHGGNAVSAAIIEFTEDAAAEPRSSELPRPGLATILFTDLASSTALTQRLGDAKLHEVRRIHNTIVRDALAAHDGTEIKHTGDGIMASFGSASGALECAIAVQRGVAERDDVNLGVHIGLNAGEPIVDERDIFGTSVDLARRVCDEASGGEILVSDVVRQLAAGKDFLFSDRGVAALKGFDEPVRVWEVRWREG